MYALKTVMYLLNRVPSKAVPKTPFELWTNRTPNIRHLHVWGCHAEIRIYNSQERKLDARTISGYFIGDPKNSKGYMFYCPNHSIRAVETGNARFIENCEISGSTVPREVEIKKVRVQVPLACASSNKVISPLVVVKKIIIIKRSSTIMSLWYIMNLLWKNHKNIKEVSKRKEISYFK